MVALISSRLPSDGQRRFRSAYVRAIHVLAIENKGVDARVKLGHDD